MSGFLASLPGACAQGIIWGIMAVGVYLTFKVLDLADLTVDGSFGTGGAVLVVCTIAGMNIWLAMLLAFLAGCIAGLVTGILHTKFGIPAILAGILTQLALYSVNLRIMSGRANVALNIDEYGILVSLRYIPKSILVGGAFALVIIGLLYWFFGTELGAGVRATGCNEAMARANGINTGFNKVLGLVLSNGTVLSDDLFEEFVLIVVGEGVDPVGRSLSDRIGDHRFPVAFVFDFVSARRFIESAGVHVELDVAVRCGGLYRVEDDGFAAQPAQQVVPAVLLVRVGLVVEPGREVRSKQLFGGVLPN